MRAQGLFVIVFMLLFSSALAQPTSNPASDEARAKGVELSKKASAAYTKGDFEVALALYEKAYALYQSPNILYNISLCHRKLNHPEEEVKSLCSFTQTFPSDATNEKAKKRLSELGRECPKSVTPEESKTPISETITPEFHKKEEPNQPIEEATVRPPSFTNNALPATASAPALKETKGPHLGRFVIPGGLIAGGLTLGGLSLLAATQEKDLTQNDAGEAADLELLGGLDRRRVLFGLASDVLLVAGLTSAGVFYFKGRKEKQGEVSLSVSPSGVSVVWGNKCVLGF